MISPLRVEDDALLVLDQRRLAREEAWLRCERPEDVADAIRTLAVRGAPAIGLAAAYGLALAVEGDERCGEEARVRFDEAARLLAGTRPTAVNLRCAIDRGREAFEAAAAAGEDARWHCSISRCG